MKKLFWLGLALTATVFVLDRMSPAIPDSIGAHSEPASFHVPAAGRLEGDALLRDAWHSQISNLPVQGTGIVDRILPDDNEGSRHQRFILRLESGQTLLVAHNIDLAPRVTGLQEGDTVSFAGEYEWNDRGGVIHWTHHDPKGLHPGGWLRHSSRTYQ